MLARVEASGLTLEHAQKLHLQSFTTEEAGSLGLSVKAAGFKLPYFELSGKPNGFFRYRVLEAPPKTGFAALTDAKTPKYLQPADSHPSVYLPPIIDGKWSDVIQNVGQPLIITEGELKAAAACARGYVTVGLGGVWNFRSKRLNLKLLPLLEQITWRGREVHILFDSDAIGNPDILRAEGVLAAELDRRGARVSVARLPQLDADAKTGLDDFLLARTDDDLDAVLDAAVPYIDSRELHRLNEEVTYIRNPGFIMRLDNLQKMSPEAFVKHQYAPRVHVIKEAGPKGVKLVERPAAAEWLRWGARSQAEKLTYAPGAERFVNGELNAWPGWGVDPVAGDVGPWKKLLDDLFKGHPTERKYFEQWCAYPLQHPGTKMYVAAVVWHRQTGIGKSAIGATLMRVYGQNGALINDSHLNDRDKFNPWQENKQFIFGDDIDSQDKRRLAGTIKNMITQEQVWVNIKHVSQFSLPDVMNYYFTSNNGDAFYLEDEDRRFFVHTPEHWPTADWFRDVYVPWMKGDGPAHLFHHLLKLDLRGFEPHAPAMTTAAKRSMMAAGQSALGAWVRELRDDPDNVLRYGKVVNAWTLATAEDLLNLYDPTGRTGTTAQAMGRELGRAGMKLVQRDAVKLSDGRRVSLWVVRHRLSTKKPKPVWLAKIYETEHLLSGK